MNCEFRVPEQRNVYLVWLFRSGKQMLGQETGEGHTVKFKTSYQFRWGRQVPVIHGAGMGQDLGNLMAGGSDQGQDKVQESEEQGESLPEEQMAGIGEQGQR